MAVEFHALESEEPQPVCPLRRLLLLKQAVRAVSQRMATERGRAAAEALEPDDKVGLTMRFIRAVEDKRAGVMRRCLQAYPHLQTLVADPMGLLHLGGAGLGGYRHHAIELARESAIGQLSELHDEPAEASEHGHRRDRLMQALRRLSPGRPTAVPAVRNARGEIVTDPDEMAAALRAHWSSVFASCHIDRRLLRDWLREDISSVGLPPVDSQLWAPTRDDVRSAVEASPNSAPGPDGLPFLAWRVLGPLAVDVLHGALQQLASDPGSPELAEFLAGPSAPLAFNSSIMVLLPKAPWGVDEQAGEFFDPGDTRPLNIVNSDNRILANAVRLRIEPLLASWISPGQRGFVGGRSMLANAVEVDVAMMQCALCDEAGMAVFFECKAAFPSVAHDFL